MREIAPQIGVTFSALQGFLHRRQIHGQPFDRPKKVDELALKTMLAAGHTQAQIAKALGVSRSAIERRAQRRGLQTARSGPRCGPGHPDWRTGRVLEKHAYIVVWAPLHPLANASTGRVLEHRMLMETMLGRYLTRAEVVHHRDEHPWHNWPSNLELYACNADHLRDELSGRVKATPRSSIPDAYGCSLRTGRCPSADETLARCPSKIRQKLDWFVVSHRPRTEHQTMPRREFLRTGAWRAPFQSVSKA